MAPDPTIVAGTNVGPDPDAPIPHPGFSPDPDQSRCWPIGDHNHAQHAHDLLDIAGTDAPHAVTTAQRAQLDALRGIGHALLAIHQELVTRRAHGAGY